MDVQASRYLGGRQRRVASSEPGDSGGRGRAPRSGVARLALTPLLGWGAVWLWYALLNQWGSESWPFAAELLTLPWAALVARHSWRSVRAALTGDPGPPRSPRVARQAGHLALALLFAWGVFFFGFLTAVYLILLPVTGTLTCLYGWQTVRELIAARHVP